MCSWLDNNKNYLVFIRMFHYSIYVYTRVVKFALRVYIKDEVMGPAIVHPLRVEEVP